MDLLWNIIVGVVLGGIILTVLPYAFLAVVAVIVYVIDLFKK